MFDNMTTFTITPDFSNHHWEVETADIYSEDSEEVRFVLELVQLYPEEDGLRGKNCSSEVSYELRGSGGVPVVAGVRNDLRVVLLACLLSRVLVAVLKE